MAGFEPTRGDLARDQVVMAVGSAYSRLTADTRAQLTAYLAGPRTVPEGYEVAAVLIGTTSDADLAFVLARLLVMADDLVMPCAFERAAAEQAHPLRRSTDTTKG